MVEAVAGMATLIRLARSPMGTFEECGRQAAGAVMPLSIGPFRPLLVTRPEHVQHVLRDRADNYLRDGMLWRPLRRLLGEGLAGEGDAWASHRRLVQTMLAAKHVHAILDALSEAVGTAVVELDAT